MKTFFLYLAFGIAFPLPLSAQLGNSKAHPNMDDVVPAEVIPPAPVLAIEEALNAFTIADGFIIEPVAVEPLVEKPVALTFDETGRMWVVEMRGYMPDLDGNGEELKQGRISILEDTDNDGRMDKRTVFWDGIYLPRALALVKDGALVADHTTLYFVGRNGTERTSEPVVVDPNYAPSGNVEHRPNTMMPHLNNWFYNSKSSIRHRWKNGKLERDETQFRGQWGLSMDSFGRIYHNNNSVILRGDRLLPDVIEAFPTAKLGNDSSTQLGTNRVWPIRVTPGCNRAYMAKKNGYDIDLLDPETHKLINTTASAGPTFYRGDQFPDSWKDVAFTTESVVQLVKATRVTANGLELTGEHLYSDKEFLASTDERFRPVNIHTAPDGSLYLVDYYHGIIQHKTYMTSYLRKQYESRGLQGPGYGLGRVYRIRHQDKPLGPKPNLLEATTIELIDTLSHPNGWWRDTAQRLIIERNEPDSIAPLKATLRTHSDETTRIHALWTLEGLEQLNKEDFTSLLSKESSEGMKTHALTALLGTEFLQNSEILSLVKNLKENANLKPYALRVLSAGPDTPSLLTDTDYSGPFTINAVATGLLSQNLPEFPKTNSPLDIYLERFEQSQKDPKPEDRLSGEHLASFKRGGTLYNGMAACIGCHGPSGAGLPNLGPPLDESEWVTGSPERLAKILLHGMQGPITVNGIDYKPLAAMPGMAMNPALTDSDVADIMTYIRANWSNQASLVKREDVATIRENTKDRNGRVYTAEELNE